MSHLLFWPTITYFYPVGNTSAVCLTENLPLESKADVLLLACGDPRHILYTIYAEETNPLTCRRMFDITCCDIDVAILARNALLFTLLADDGALDKLDGLWNLFYHMFVDRNSLSILFEQCHKLIALAESMETWRAGPYGHFLTACDAGTLAGLRRIWTAYLDMATFSSQQEKQFEREFINGKSEMSRRRGPGSATTAARSAGPLASHADLAVSRQFGSYWSSGTTDDGAQGQGQSQRRRLSVNPTFAFSLDGDGFAVHYATDPLCGFHLAEAFASGKFTRPQERIPPHELVRVAKDQFSRWCTSVSKRLKDTNPSSSTFVIRMFAGDVLRFCQALKYCEAMRSPVTPYTVAAWRLSTITLDDHCYGPNAVSPAPLSFDVIDTSNILDHVGLVNLLVVTAPLLCKTSSATLYTEALLGKGGKSSQTDLEHICGDLPTMALLLGVIPSTFISQFTTRSNVYQDLTTGGGAKQYHERLAWKAIEFGGSRAQHSFDDPTPPKRLIFPPEDLAQFLLHVYVQMFSDEDVESRFQQLSSFSFERLVESQQRSGILHYNRRSFALFLHFAKTRVQTDWQRAMVLFEKLVMTDGRLLMGQHAYQELCCQLHLLGVYTTEWVSAPALQRLRLEYEGGTSGANVGLFCDWTRSSIPQVVVLALVVPHEAITRLEPDFREIGTPMLQCDMQEGPRANSFAVASATFGSLRVIGKAEHRMAVVVVGANAGTDTETDASMSTVQPPWRTEAPMIITFSVPTTSVMDFARNPGATVGLALRATPSVATKLSGRLGLELTMFRTRLRDAERVFVLAQAPVVDTSTGASTSRNASAGAGAGAGAVMADHWQENMMGNSSSARAASDLGVHVQMNGAHSAIQSLTIRVDVADPDAQADLAKPQTVPTLNSGPGTMRSLDGCLTIRKHTFALQFPLPVDISHAKLRVARRSSYVEVVAPLASLDARFECDLSNRSLSSDPNNDNTPKLGSIHRLNLDRCLMFKLPKGPSESDWCKLHIGRMFSELEEERTFLTQFELPEASSSASGPIPDTLLHVKKTLSFLLRSAADATRDGKASEKVFALCDTSRREAPYLYIVVARMCLDVGSHTVVADAFVALGTPAVRAALETTLRDAYTSTSAKGTQAKNDTAIQRLTTGADETTGWFHLLPRLTERCRTWPHKTSCSYRTLEQKPSEESGRRSSLCMCGLGIGTEILPKAFERVAPYLTRAAFSPLMSVPYLEEIDTPMGGPDMDSVMRSPWNADIGKIMGTVGLGHRCRSCGEKGSLACSRCKRVRYCSKECQRTDWKAHKKDCKSAS